MARHGKVRPRRQGPGHRRVAPASASPDVLEIATVPIAVNQVRFAVWGMQDGRIRAVLKDNGITYRWFSPSAVPALTLRAGQGRSLITGRSLLVSAADNV